MQDTTENIACEGNCYKVSIYSIKLDVKFCFPHELRKSIYLECTEDFVQSLNNRPVVGYMLETSPLHDKKVVLGDILLSVNDVQVNTPKEANQKIRTSRRPLKLLFYAPKVKLTISEGFHMCKYNTSTAKPPSSSLKWKPKYVVIGGVVSTKPWMMYMYRNKTEYDRAVMETISGKAVSVKVKHFSLRDATLLYRDETEAISYDDVDDKDKVMEWVYFVIIPNEKTRQKPIKIASPNDVCLRPVLEAVQRIINQDCCYDGHQRSLFGRNLPDFHSILHHNHRHDVGRRGSTGSINDPPQHPYNDSTQNRRNSSPFEHQSHVNRYSNGYHKCNDNMHQLEKSEDDYQLQSDHDNYHSNFQEENDERKRSTTSSISEFDVTAASDDCKSNPYPAHKNDETKVDYSFKDKKGDRVRSNHNANRRNSISGTTINSSTTKSTSKSSDTEFTNIRNSGSEAIIDYNIETLMMMNPGLHQSKSVTKSKSKLSFKAKRRGSFTDSTKSIGALSSLGKRSNSSTTSFLNYGLDSLTVSNSTGGNSNSKMDITSSDKDKSFFRKRRSFTKYI